MSGLLGGVSNAVGAGSAVVGQIGSALNSVRNLGSDINGLLNRGSTSYSQIATGLGQWANKLQAASWRGQQFAVTSSNIQRGRRTAVHEYAFRNDVWVEDLGLGTRMITFSGFLIGDDVFSQRDQMVIAAETAGTGTLVHPSLGSLTATLIEFSAGERADLGRVVEIQFSFIQGTSTPVSPAASAATQSLSLGASISAWAASAQDFVSDVTSAVSLGFSVAQGAIGTVMSFVSQVVGTVQSIELLGEDVIALPSDVIGSIIGTSSQIVGLINDAALTSGVIAGLLPPTGSSYDRYNTAGLTAYLPAAATAASQLAVLATNRGAVQASVSNLLLTALNAPLTLPAAVQEAFTAFTTAVINPSDQIRLLSVLAAFAPVIPASSASIGSAIATFQTAAAALIRRTACGALASASAAYQPTSYNDAIAVMIAVTGFIDTESISAADAGDTDSYLALRQMRAMVAQDLLTRGAVLPTLLQITRQVPIPSLVLAYELYGDATRSDDLISRADPVSPLFMPTNFQALSS
jgi:prophage DNA circulation protein